MLAAAPSKTGYLKNKARAKMLGLDRCQALASRCWQCGCETPSTVEQADCGASRQGHEEDNPIHQHASLRFELFIGQ